MTHPLYASMQFPDYQFEEYPKHVYPDGPKGKFVVVNNEEEEKLALASEPIVREEDEKKRLIALADVHGVQVDRRWNVVRLSKAIEDGGFDSSVDPFQ